MKPKIVCLCGSTKFKEAFEKANEKETISGKIVLSVGLYGHLTNLDMNGDTKKMLDELHLRKIDISDEILVINVNGYIGESTSNEIKYAISKGKAIRFLEEGYIYPNIFPKLFSKNNITNKKISKKYQLIVDYNISNFILNINNLLNEGYEFHENLFTFKDDYFYFCQAMISYKDDK